jgi:hypothetical protein
MKSASGSSFAAKMDFQTQNERDQMTDTIMPKATRKIQQTCGIIKLQE